MNNAQHTPGPWRYKTDEFGDFIIHPTDHMLAIAVVVNGAFRIALGKSSQIEANARLIAAAPDLLAFAKATADAYDDSWREGCQERLIGDAARAAIAKAEGR